MKDPEPYDEDEYYETLGQGDQKAFAKLFSKKWRGIDEERALESYKSTFEATEEPEHILFKDVVNAFSDKRAAEGSDSGFETTIVNPLLEFGDSCSEILLANITPTGVHLCFVSCNIGGEKSESWRRDINNTYNIVQEDGRLERLLGHIQCEGEQISTVQYITFTRDPDIVNADAEVLKVGTDPDNYAIWKLIQSIVPPADPEEDGDEDKTIQHHTGDIIHPDLDEISRDGIDPTLAENDGIKYNLTSHPIYPIGEISLQIYLNHLGDKEEPKEFYQSEFENEYEGNICLGSGRNEADELVEDEVENLLDIARECDIYKEEKADERDYKIMWDSEEAGDIKDMVRHKYFKNKVPEETGSIAFERARKQFEPEEHSLSDFDYE